MRKDRGASATECVLLVLLIAVMVSLAISLTSTEVNDSDIPDVPENALNVETYQVGNYTGTIVRWEDPDYDVVCWTRMQGRRGGGVSCVPKSQLAPLGPTVIP